MRPLLAVALLAALAPAAPVPKPLKKPDDKTALTGTWRVTELSVNGRTTTVTYETFAFDAEGAVTLRSKNDDTYTPQWSFTLDPEASPRRMQWSSAKGRIDWELVYELEGDSLKVGFIKKGANPPAKVEPSEGLTLYVMSRETPSK